MRYPDVFLRHVILSIAIYETWGFSPLVELGSKEQDPVKFYWILHFTLFHSE